MRAMPFQRPPEEPIAAAWRSRRDWTSDINAGTVLVHRPLRGTAACHKEESPRALSRYQMSGMRADQGELKAIGARIAAAHEACRPLVPNGLVGDGGASLGQ